MRIHFLVLLLDASDARCSLTNRIIRDSGGGDRWTIDVHAYDARSRSNRVELGVYYRKTRDRKLLYRAMTGSLVEWRYYRSLAVGDSHNVISRVVGQVEKSVR
jgi:hypothetical protein